MQYNPHLDFNPTFDTGAKLQQEQEMEEKLALENDLKMKKRGDLAQMINLNKNKEQRKQKKIGASVMPSTSNSVLEDATDNINIMRLANNP